VSGLRVALDGPGSSGKSSVGAAAALELGYRFLDTGILYRAITLLSVLREIDPDDGTALAAVVPELRMVADDRGRVQQVEIDGHDVTDQLHVPAVDRRVSAVAARPQVRSALLRAQRALADDGAIILAGRDIGTVVLPDADLKLYLQVSVEERAQRRAAERGLALDSEEAATILDDLRRRDEADSSRDVAPLRVPDDAVIVTSDGKAFDETVAAVVEVIRRAEGEGSHP
jgi:cytidylate kinase